MVDVECPHCGNTRTFVPKNGTDKNTRIRCSKGSGGCGKLFWSKNNMVIVVPQTRTEVKTNRALGKDMLIRKIYDKLLEYKDYIPIEVFRSKLLEIESIGEMRKR